MKYPRFVGKSILLVEDNNSYSHFLEMQLKSKGFTVLIAGSFQGAVEILDQGDEIHLALVDMYIPDEEGGRDRVQRGEQLCYLIKGRIPEAIILGMSNNLESEPRTPIQDLFAGFFYKDDMRENEEPIVLWETVDSLLQHDGRRMPKCFVVHGHDENLTLELKDFIQNKLKFEQPIVLRDAPDQGKTIIEKFEAFARRADVAFVCLTPDEEIRSVDDDIRRSRPNVILELGFFYAKFQRRRGRVFLLTKGKVEIPTDISGIIWIDVTAGLDKHIDKIKTELRIAGFPQYDA